MGDVFNVNDIEHASVNYVLSSLGENEWLVDSACSYHMTPHKSHFSNYSSLKNSYVSMADNVKREVAGIGDVCLNICGYELLLKNVRHVPDLSHNLISCCFRR